MDDFYRNEIMKNLKEINISHENMEKLERVLNLIDNMLSPCVPKVVLLRDNKSSLSDEIMRIFLLSLLITYCKDIDEAVRTNKEIGDKLIEIDKVISKG